MKKSKVFFLVFFLMLTSSIGLACYRYYIQRDYIITSRAKCDPYTEACFISLCDSGIEECSGNPDEDTIYYKNISRNAKNIPSCDPIEEGCLALTCPPGETDCMITLCDASVDDAVICNNPKDYTLLHPKNLDEVAIPSDE